MRLPPAQLVALAQGPDRSRVLVPRVPRPTAAAWCQAPVLDERLFEHSLHSSVHDAGTIPVRISRSIRQADFAAERSSPPSRAKSLMETPLSSGSAEAAP
jgi:hypothetical protein